MQFDQYEKNTGILGRYRALLATLNKQSPPIPPYGAG
jgi:hypothetical protein